MRFQRDTTPKLLYMNPKNLLIIKTVVVAAFALMAQALSAAVWVEVPDAGQTLPTAQGTGLPEGQSLTTIFGALDAPNDVDLFRISITTPSTFSATTVNAL